MLLAWRDINGNGEANVGVLVLLQRHVFGISIITDTDSVTHSDLYPPSSGDEALAV